MVPGPKPATAAKVSDTRSMLLEQHINALGLQRCDEPVAAVQSVGQHHIAHTQSAQ